MPIMKKFLFPLFAAIFLIALIYQSFNVWIARNDRDVAWATANFLMNATEQICLDKQAIVNTAIAKNLNYLADGDGLDSVALNSFPPEVTDMVQVDLGVYWLFTPRNFMRFPLTEEGCWLKQ